MIKNISNLGDSAVYCDFGDKVTKEINSNVIKYFESLKKNKILGITNITPSYNKLIISYDLEKIRFDQIKNKILEIKTEDINSDENKIIKIPVCTDEEFCLDIERLSKKLKLDIGKILNIFFNKKYFCYMTGFIAGMPFLGDIDKALRLKRLETPRVKVPKGSIGITEQFSNIYTYESPGGWNIIGNTPTKIFDKLNQDNPLKINPGDIVEFYEITKTEYLNWNE
jgi:KipI family sensor histidine kinase inhibitor|tara:strand:+ start:18 stop:692 length:675 start_codon:yes stop_codon:yes gene_type:complete